MPRSMRDQFLVIGSGVAGLRAALNFAKWMGWSFSQGHPYKAILFSRKEGSSGLE